MKENFNKTSSAQTESIEIDVFELVNIFLEKKWIIIIAIILSILAGYTYCKVKTIEYNSYQSYILLPNTVDDLTINNLITILNLEQSNHFKKNNDIQQKNIWLQRGTRIIYIKIQGTSSFDSLQTIGYEYTKSIIEYINNVIINEQNNIAAKIIHEPIIKSESFSPDLFSTIFKSIVIVAFFLFWGISGSYYWNKLKNIHRKINSPTF